MEDGNEMTHGVLTGCEELVVLIESEQSCTLGLFSDNHHHGRGLV